MNTEMENNNSILNKLSCLSVGESAVDQPQAEMEARLNNRRMCNELIHELCKEIPIAETSERILLTSFNTYTYLGPRHRKMRLIFWDAIAFLKAKLNAKKKVQVFIRKQLCQNKESESIVVINQKQSYKEFKLETNKFYVRICNRNHSQNEINIFGQSECVHSCYFLRLIAPLLRPIQLRLDPNSPRIPIEVLVRFMNTQSEWIDSIDLPDCQFNSEPIYGTLWKYYKLHIYGAKSPSNAPKLVHWLTSNNNNGQQKKYLILDQDLLIRGLASLIDDLKKEFACATSKSRFVVRLGLRRRLDEFTLGNELTGERLELRLKNIACVFHTYTLSRFPNNELDANENDFAESDNGMTKIRL